MPVGLADRWRVLISSANPLFPHLQTLVTDCSGALLADRCPTLEHLNLTLSERILDGWIWTQRGLLEWSLQELPLLESLVIKLSGGIDSKMLLSRSFARKV